MTTHEYTAAVLRGLADEYDAGSITDLRGELERAIFEAECEAEIAVLTGAGET